MVNAYAFLYVERVYSFHIKSVSPVKPCKVVQKQGSPICMKFCEFGYTIPKYCKSQKKNSDWFNIAAV